MIHRRPDALHHQDLDAELETRLAAAGAVVIEGPKAGGKTETARQRAASSVLLDIDAVVALPDGRWGAFEVKLGSGLVDEGAAASVRFRDALDTARTSDPAVLGVISGTASATWDLMASP